MPQHVILYEQIFMHSISGVLIVRADGAVLRANPAACAELKRSEEEIVRAGWGGLAVEDARPVDALDRLETLNAAQGEIRFRLPDGTFLLALFTAAKLKDGDGQSTICFTFNDHGPRRKQETVLWRTRRALRLLTRCNQAVARASSEEALFAELCRAMVEVGGYRMCWVGIAEHDEAKTVRPIAHAGMEDGYIAAVNGVWDENAPNGRGPIGKAIRTGKPVIGEYFGDDPTLSPWREQALKRGYKRSIGVPLLDDGRAIGVISMYSADLDAFDDEELEILGQLSHDVSHGLHLLRERLEQAQRNSELRAVQSIAHIGTWTLNVQTGERTWSDEMYRICGLDPATFNGDLAVVAPNAIHPDDRAGVLQGIQDAFERDIASERTYRILRPDGSERIVWAQSGHFTRDPSGKPLMLAGILQDVTERKRAEAERDRLIMAIEQAAEIVVVSDIAGNIVYANPAFERITGYSRAEVLGKNPRLLKSGQQPDEFYYRTLWATIGNGETWHGRMVNRRKDGTLFTEEATISPVRDAVGVITNYVAVKRDITRDLGLEAQLLQSQKMEGIGRLAGGIAHDFNNILTVILSCTDVLLQGAQEGSGLREDLLEIDHAGKRAATLTRQLLAFSRKQVLQPVPLDLNRAITDLEKMLRRIIGEDVKLSLELAPDLGVVQADPGQFEQVLMNLVINARHAMPEGGKLRIASRNVTLGAEHVGLLEYAATGPCVMIEVTDTGSGMDAQTIVQIFEPFFTTKARDQGTGLGLSTVYGIIKQHRGHIEVESALGQGTTFKIFLPRQEPTAETVPTETAPTQSAVGSETVLLVEDDRTIRTICERMLTNAGYTVLAATNGREALALFSSQPSSIAMILSDVVMPEMGGPQFVERAKQFRPDVKVLFMSGYNDAAMASLHGLGSGRHFIAKPFAKPDLLARIRDILDR